MSPSLFLNEHVNLFRQIIFFTDTHVCKRGRKSSSGDKPCFHLDVDNNTFMEIIIIIIIIIIMIIIMIII